MPSSFPLPLTRWHYAANGNFGSSGQYLPGADGFNLADVSSKYVLNSLPAGVRGLVYLGTCAGATSSFDATVDAFAGNAKLFGFYVIDEPTSRRALPPTSRPRTTGFTVTSPVHTPSRSSRTSARRSLRALAGTRPPTATLTLSAWIRTRCAPNSARRTTLRSANPSPTFRRRRAGRSARSCRYSRRSAGAAGEATATWTLPTPSEEQQLLATWASVLPGPLFDYAYSWGQQKGDTSLSMSPGLQQVFAAHNA